MDAISSLTLVHGLPKAVLRVLGWMVVCQPREQTASSIQDALGLSAGTVSVAVRTLGDIGLVERMTRPGHRCSYYRISTDGWERVLEARFRALTELREVADRALEASGGRERRLAEMRDTFAAYETGVHGLLRRSREHPARRAAAGLAPVGRDA